MSAAELVRLARRNAANMKMSARLGQAVEWDAGLLRGEAALLDALVDAVERASTEEGLGTAERPAQTCGSCGAPATCFGSYEGHASGFACDDCCGHGCEDGECVLIVDPPPEVTP
jgi:hypothetical protein